MSEMLGNQYFMARNYTAAQNEFEKVLLKETANKSIKKKIIVCYTQTGRVKDAIKLFNELISENIEFIIDTDPVLDDCPCFELVEKIEGTSTTGTNSLDSFLISGIIWLYCDANKSYEYFKKAELLSPLDENIGFTLQALKKYFDAQKIS